MSRHVLTTLALLVIMVSLGLWVTTSVSMPVRAASGVREAVLDAKTNPSSSLTIIKEAPNAPPDNQFVFFGDLGDFDLKPDEAQTFTNLPAGDYNVLEDGRSFPDDGPWYLTSVRCQVEGGGWFFPEVYDGGDIYYFTGARIPVGAAEHVTCTFLNNVRVEEYGSLTIIKEAPNAPPDNQFVFFGDLGDFDLKPDEAQTFTDLPAGDYDVVEDGRSFPDEGNWKLVNVRCQVQGGDWFYPPVYDGGDIFYFTGAAIPVGAAEHVTCIFLNVRVDEDNSLTIIKEATNAPPNNQFVFFGDLGDFDLKPGEAQSFTNLPAGVYSVLEDGRSFPDEGHWDLLSVRCQVATGGEFYPPVYNGGDIFYFTGADITLEDTVHVACIFLNEPANIDPNRYQLYLPLVIKQ